MPTKEDWIAVGLILGAVAVVGIAFYVLSRKKASAQRIQLKRVRPRVVLRNLERREYLRDREGNLKAIVIHREVKQVD